MKRFVWAVLMVASAAWGDAPRVQLPKGFTPNPLLVPVQRAEGGAVALEPAFATCKDLAAGALVSKSAVAVLEVPEGLTHLTLQASQSDRLIARRADGTTSCGEKLLALDVKPGPLEVFVVTAAAVLPEKAAGKLRVFDADRPRLLPESVKTVSLPLTLTGEVGDGKVPDAQLEVPAKVEGLTWKTEGAAAEVWLTLLALEDVPAVKATDALQPGRYAVWIRGPKRGAFTVTASLPAPPAVAEAPPSPPPPPPAAEPAPAPAPAAPADVLAFTSKPAADATVEARVLATFLPALQPKALDGFSKDAQALRKRAFTELPAEFFVFAAADGEVLLPLSYDGAQVALISADGATFSMPPSELTVKPPNGEPLVRSQRTELMEKLTLNDLAPEKDPRVASLEKLKKQIQACIEKHPEWPDAAKRCNASKGEKAQTKLMSALKKAYAKQRAAELAAIQKRVKADVAATP